MKKINFVEHQSICALPWTGIFVNPDGSIKNCAISNQSIGNINLNSLEHIVNSSQAQDIRTDMLNNIRHPRCNSCYSVEDNAANKKENESNRSWYKKIAIKNVKNFDIFDSSDNFQPVILDLRWKNTCNHACVYCGPDLSSMWSSLTDVHTQIDEHQLAQSKLYIEQNLQSVKHIYLAGGEPLLMKDNADLLEKMYVINPDVEIRINSNISNINTPVFEILKKFNNVKWTISVDSTADSFEYMRWPGKWSQFTHNLQEIKKIVGDQINFNMVWCILNDVEIFDAVDYLLEQGFHENMFIVQCLTSPSPLSVLNLPKEKKEQLKDKIYQRQQLSNPSWWLYKSLSSMYNFLEQPENNKTYKFYSNSENMSPGITGTFEYLNLVDQYRGTNSQEIFKKLFQYK
jgi:radical SAM protein with 4Fe4S-binding SPASM domain